MPHRHNELTQVFEITPTIFVRSHQGTARKSDSTERVDQFRDTGPARSQGRSTPGRRPDGRRATRSRKYERPKCRLPVGPGSSSQSSSHSRRPSSPGAAVAALRPRRPSWHPRRSAVVWLGSRCRSPGRAPRHAQRRHPRTGRPRHPRVLPSHRVAPSGTADTFSSPWPIEASSRHLNGSKPCCAQICRSHRTVVCTSSMACRPCGR